MDKKYIKKIKFNEEGKIISEDIVLQPPKSNEGEGEGKLRLLEPPKSNEGEGEGKLRLLEPPKSKPKSNKNK